MVVSVPIMTRGNPLKAISVRVADSNVGAHDIGRLLHSVQM